MQVSSQEIVLELLKKETPPTILDAPCGKGWLGKGLADFAEVDGIDLYDSPAKHYREVRKADLDRGLPLDLPLYDCICSCEGIEHFANPGLFLDSALDLLKPGGLLVITTPSVWYPEAKLQYWLRGFFPGFPCLVGRIERGTHMHIMPWSWPHLYLYLTLSGFTDIQLVEEPLSKPRHFWEPILALPQKLYCRSKIGKTSNQEDRRFWEIAGSTGSLCGRHLIVTGRKPGQDR